MNCTASQTDYPAPREYDPNTPKEARDLYRELTESGIFNISWQQFMWYWFQSQSDEFPTAV